MMAYPMLRAINNGFFGTGEGPETYGYEYKYKDYDHDDVHFKNDRDVTIFVIAYIRRIALKNYYGVSYSAWANHQYCKSIQYMRTLVLLYVALVCAQLALSVSKPRVVCYYPNYRLKVNPIETIDPTLCTHIHYAFHILDTNNNVIVDRVGARPDIYRRLNALKTRNPELKVIVSVGGAKAPSEPFSNLVNNSSLRAEFINNTIAYLKQYGFDGLDLDWEYPVCWAGNCTAGPQSDRANFGKLLRELKAAFDKQSPRLSLSAAVKAGKPGGPYEQAYDFSALAESLDYINVMTYVLYGPWNRKTGHHSPYQKCIDYSQSYVTKGVPNNKVLIGVPFYGKVFALKNSSQHSMGAPITGAGNTPDGHNGAAYYREMCDLVKNKSWLKETNDQGHDPFAYHDNLWVGYDDPYQK
ncbi:unnamed protein product [Medioppia subpectinata]|uniref:GH18 domain-containing protein n=1 Tax=Medioppia subpectinata TaxID=1979941 RepID=A0A7R9Q271_9ACAR|nr:unnamed protein product [Medioppia subpectinata]CAG2109990.1 unnamed protein product [Medioppia subpectinata]